MHIILGVLGAIITILILVNRLSDNGINIGWLNPFAWKRRREWAKKYHANPVYSLTNPMEVTSLITIALVKSEGEVSTEQKREIKNKFQEIFHLSEEKASSLFTSSTFLLRNDTQVLRHIDQILEASLSNFSEEKASSAYELMTHIASFDSSVNSVQKEAIELFKQTFYSKYKSANEWR